MRKIPEYLLVLYALSGTLSIAVSGGTTVVQGSIFEPDGITPVNLAEITARNSSGDKIGLAFTNALGAYTLVIP